MPTTVAFPWRPIALVFLPFSAGYFLSYFFRTTVLSYSILAEYFPKEMAGQANAALNVFHIGGAFAVQEFIGWIVDRWPSMAATIRPSLTKAHLC